MSVETGKLPEEGILVASLQRWPHNDPSTSVESGLASWQPWPLTGTGRDVMELPSPGLKKTASFYFLPLGMLALGSKPHREATWRIIEAHSPQFQLRTHPAASTNDQPGWVASHLDFLSSWTHRCPQPQQYHMNRGTPSAQENHIITRFNKLTLKWFIP